MAPPATIYDDSDSDDADDEYATDDEYLILSSSDTQGEHDDTEGSHNGWDGNRPLYQSFYDIGLESNETEEDDLPVVRLNLSRRPDVAVGDEATNTPENNHITNIHTSLVLEQSISLREGAFALVQQDEEDGGDDTDGWELASARCCDSGALELEAAEEDRAARGKEQLTVAKLRHQSRLDTSRPPQRALNSRHPGRKVGFFFER
ncbi:hypothetical protein PG994_011239 [Apiospora phragmitis]|uniref:Uncharacterized protein n=1 Tax=Apiospora phragmitis TaxID=2905665 RepID=A0ABR1TSC1_9PEZI